MPLRHPATWPFTWSVGGMIVRGNPSRKSATEYPLSWPLKSNRPRGSLAAWRAVLCLRTSNPARMLWDPRFHAAAFESWNVRSHCGQFVPPFPSPWNPLTLTEGMPGLLNRVSPSNPGMPRLVPTSAGPFTRK